MFFNSRTLPGHEWLLSRWIAVLEKSENLGEHCLSGAVVNTAAFRELLPGVPDDRLGEVAMAFVVPASGTTVDRGELIAWCRENMANYKVPRRVVVVDALPMNATGKVTKFVLREQATAAPPR